MISISVLMSIYNEPLEWIDQSIKSIQGQLYSDFEFLIVNDNPERIDTRNLLCKYARNDRRIRVLNNKKNMGLSASMNLLIGMSTGKYIARMDADDISLPDRFQKQYQFMENNPDVGVCGCFARIINSEGRLGNRMFIYSTNEELQFANIFYTPFVHPTVFFRKNIIQTNLYNESYRIIGLDTDLWLRLSSKTKFHNISQVLFYYRIHGNNSDNYENQLDKYSINMKNAILSSSLFLIEEQYVDLYIKYKLCNDSISISEIENMSIYLYEKYHKEYPLCLEILTRKYVSYVIKRKAYYKLFCNAILGKYKLKYLRSLISVFSIYCKLLNKFHF